MGKPSRKSAPLDRNPADCPRCGDPRAWAVRDGKAEPCCFLCARYTAGPDGLPSWFDPPHGPGLISRLAALLAVAERVTEDMLDAGMLEPDVFFFNRILGVLTNQASTLHDPTRKAVPQ